MTTGLSKRNSRAQAWFVFSFLAPPVALYALFVLLPTINAFRYSLTRWDGLSDPVYVGMRNFRSFLAPGSDFIPAIQHNLFLMLVPGVFILSLALMFANMIHQRIKGAKVFRIAFFFPNIISSVAVALLWMLIYSPTKVGLLNHFAAIWFHRTQPVPYTESSRLLTSLVPMTVWSATGFYMVLFLAAMENIPETYYEAARLDGAGPTTLFFRITMPMMWEVFTTGVIFLIIGGLKYFDAIWVLENGRPKTATHTMSTLMYSRVFEQYNIGYGTAIAVLLFLLVLIVTVVSRRLLQREALEY